MYLFLNICRWFFKCDIRHGCWDDEKETEDKQRLRKGTVAQKDVSAVVSVGQPHDSSHVQYCMKFWLVPSLFDGNITFHTAHPIIIQKNEPMLLLKAIVAALSPDPCTQLKHDQQHPLHFSPANQFYCTVFLSPCCQVLHRSPPIPISSLQVLQ